MPRKKKNKAIPKRKIVDEWEGWKVGDTLRVQTGDKGTIIITKKEEDGTSIVIQPKEDA